VRILRLYPELAPGDGRRRVIVPRPVKPPGRHGRDAEAITGQRPATLIDNQSERPRHHAWATMWHRHPAVSPVDELTVGERAADYMRNGMGSWAFVFGALLFLAVWITFNVIVVGGGHHAFDAYPFILLNLCLSCLAAMQGAILLIAAKRADQVSSELAAHDYEVNCDTEMLLEENTEPPGPSKNSPKPSTTESLTPPDQRPVTTCSGRQRKPRDRVDERRPRATPGLRRRRAPSETHATAARHRRFAPGHCRSGGCAPRVTRPSSGRAGH
jgi:hypothetical protein